MYQDALRYLHRDDLSEMGITHLHITDRLEKALTSQARNLLSDPAHFKLMADLSSISGERHRVFRGSAGRWNAKSREIKLSPHA